MSRHNVAHFMYPDLMDEGWHIEAFIGWGGFGLGTQWTFGESFVIWLGPACLCFWKFDARSV